MKRTTTVVLALLIAAWTSNTIAKSPRTCPANGKLKIFILSGQSNMVGFGQLAGPSPGTMEALLKDNSDAYGHLLDKEGDTGFQYAEVLRHVKEITGNVKKYYLIGKAMGDTMVELLPKTGE